MGYINMPDRRGAGKEHRTSLMSLPHMRKRQDSQKKVNPGRAWLHGSGSQNQEALPHKEWPLHAHPWWGLPPHTGHPGMVYE